MTSRTRLAVLLWLLFACVLWHAIFDRHVDAAVWEYLRRESAHFLGQGPAVTIGQILEPGVARGAKRATLMAAGAAVVGLAGIAVAARAESRRQKAES